MKRIATAVVLIPLVIVAVVLSPDWLFATILGLIGLICVNEFLRLAGVLGDVPSYLSYAFVFTIFFLLAVAPYFRSSVTGLSELLPIVLLLLPFATLAWGLTRENYPESLRGGGLALLGLYYVTIPLLCLAILRERSFVGNYFLILLFVIVWGGDIAAFYVGKLLGRHALAPRVSPGKTWEGAIASVVFASMLTLAITQWLAPNLSGLPITRFFGPNTWGATITVFAPPFWASLLLAIFVNVSAQIGDLAESMLKRAANVKDSGTLLPGHGGMLDRIDALLFAAPIGMLVFLATEHLFAADPNIRIIIKP